MSHETQHAIDEVDDRIAKGHGGRGRLLAGAGLALALGLALGACSVSAGSGSGSSDPEASQGAAASDDGDGAGVEEAPAEEAEEVGTRANPVPINTPTAVGEWTIAIGAPDPAAAELIAAENQFNEPPAEGSQYLMVPVTMTNNGEKEQMPLVALSMKFVGANGNTFTTYDTASSCGVIPNEMMSVAELYTGATATANECIIVPSAEVAGGAWVVEESFSFSSEKVFFAAG